MLTLLTLQPGRASPAQPRVKSNFPCWPQSAVRLGGDGDVASSLFRRQRPGCGQVTRVLWGFALFLSEVKNYFYKLLFSFFEGSVDCEGALGSSGVHTFA